MLRLLRRVQRLAGTVTAWVKKHHPEIPVRSGHVVDGEAFTFLDKAGADFIEVGVGGSPICISRNQKGIGRGQASAVQDVAATRDAFRARTSAYADTLLHCHRLTDLRLAACAEVCGARPGDHRPARGTAPLPERGSGAASAHPRIASRLTAHPSAMRCLVGGELACRRHAHRPAAVCAVSLATGHR